MPPNRAQQTGMFILWEVQVSGFGFGHLGASVISSDVVVRPDLPKALN